jgi:hypothetical protein
MHFKDLPVVATLTTEQVHKVGLAMYEKNKQTPYASEEVELQPGTYDIKAHGTQRAYIVAEVTGGESGSRTEIIEVKSDVLGDNKPWVNDMLMFSGATINYLPKKEKAPSFDSDSFSP